jgi:hypothetical protein
MQARQRLALCFVPLLTLFSFVNDALASCPRTEQGPPCVEYWRTQAVFIGVANRVVTVPNNPDLAFDPYFKATVYFTIEEAFKGVGGTGVVINLDDCGYRFKEGERYLVYAHRNNNSQELHVLAGFTRTRPLSEAAEDLQYIRGLASAEPGSRVFGKVTQLTLNVKEGNLDADPLRETRVTLEGNNHRQELFTDSEGKYEFKRLPKGTYRIRAELPAYLSYDEGYGEQKIKVNGHECVPLDISGRRKGRIAGRVLDMNGKPLDFVALSIIPADASREEILAEEKDKVVRSRSYTNGEGRFLFLHVPPGRYLLIINPTDVEWSRANKGAPVLPRLFYPGVSDVGGATVIVVGNDDEPREHDFRLTIPQ